MDSFELTNEIWKPIIGYEGLYEVSSLARIRTVERIFIKINGQKIVIKERILKQGLNTAGYLSVGIYRNTKSTSTRVHRIFATAFIPNPQSKPNINHINGVKTDNRIENLEWCTQKENIQHAFRTGLVNNTGINNGQCLLNEKKVLAIKKLLLSGITQKEIAGKYSVTRSCILKIHRKESWKHIILS